MSESTKPEYLSPAAAAVRLGKTVETVLEWIRLGKLKTRRVNRKTIYVVFPDPFQEAKP